MKPSAIILLACLAVMLPCAVHAADVIGPSFASELVAAGITDFRFSWDRQTGAMLYHPGVSQATKNLVASVKAAHNPAAVAPLTGRKAALQAFTNHCLDIEADGTVGVKVRTLCARLRAIVQ